MAIMVALNDPNWRCIGAQGISGGCATDCASGDNPPCSVPQTAIAELNAGDYVGRPLPAAIGTTTAPPQVCTRAEQVLRAWLRRLAGANGETFVNHFMRGGGAPWHWASDSWLSTMIRGTTEYQSALSTVQQQIAAKLGRQAGTRPSTYDLQLDDVPWLDFWRAIPSRMSPAAVWQSFQTIRDVATSAHRDTVTVATTLASLIGGTKGCKVFVRNLQVDTSARTYSAGLRLRVCDHFGVDERDLYFPGLIALWLLQHACPGPQRPFVNVMNMEQNVTGSLV